MPLLVWSSFTSLLKDFPGHEQYIAQSMHIIHITSN